MNVLGLTISRRKAVPAGYSPIYPPSGGWFPIVREAFAGAWQRNLTITQENILTYSAVYACVTLIASDIGKLRIKLVELDKDGIWNEVENPAYSPVLRKPNRWQTHIKFKEQWMVSKLLHGNTYVLKVRDERTIVTALYVLDPNRVTVKVAPDGSVFYGLQSDNLVGLQQAIDVPASEIIHDVMVPLYHPLCGVSPITACGLAAALGLSAQQNSAKFFQNGARPSGVLSTVEDIDDEQARELQKRWEEQFSGDNQGKVAALGNGMKYEAMTIKAVDSQLIEQLKWTAANVCTAFRVPGFMIGIGDPPANTTVEARSIQYYTQTLQNPIESMEVLLDEGLKLLPDVGKKQTLGTELDLDQLMRMDTPTRVKAGQDAIGSGAVSPNEARKRFFDLGPVEGGDSPYLQVQNFSLRALSIRDAREDPFAKSDSAAPPPKPPDVTVDDEDEKSFADRFGVSVLSKVIESDFYAMASTTVAT